MDCSPTYGLSCRCKGHHTHPVYEKLGNQTESPYHKNQLYIQTIQHSRHTTCTLYTSSQMKIIKPKICCKPPRPTSKHKSKKKEKKEKNIRNTYLCCWTHITSYKSTTHHRPLRPTIKQCKKKVL